MRGLKRPSFVVLDAIRVRFRVRVRVKSLVCGLGCNPVQPPLTGDVLGTILVIDVRVRV